MRLPVVPLPNGQDGINRFNDGDSTPGNRLNELGSALDVIALEADLRRRDAFVSIGVADPHRLPCGKATLLVTDSSDSSFDSRADRDGDIDNERLYFGCDVVFDAICLDHVTLGGGATTHIALKVEYYAGAVAGWTQIFALDLTAAKTSGSTDLFQPLSRAGVIAWHRPTDWETVAVNSVTKFWVRLTFLDKDGAADIPTVMPTIRAPGLIAAIMPPVNGLCSARPGAGEQFLVVGNDAFKMRRGDGDGDGTGVRTGGMQGASLAVQRGYFRAPRPLHLVESSSLEDEGGGWYGVHSNADWAGTPGAWTEGVANQLVKTNQSYSWDVEDPVPTTYSPQAQFRGARIRTALTPAASGNSTTQITVTGLGLEDAEFEHHILRCVARSGAGPALGEERIIYACSADVINTYDAWTDTPDTNNSFEILRPHGVVVIDGKRYMVDAMDVNGHQIALKRSRPFATDPDTAATTPDSILHFEVGQELRWLVQAGERWSMVVDATQRRVVMVNGGQPLIFDGFTLRRFVADTTSDLAKLLQSKLSDAQAADDSLLAGTELAAHPPEARYVVDFGGYLVVAGLRGRPQDIAWSMPGGANNVWPLAFRQRIRDSENDEIRGLAVLGRTLLIFTPTAVHEAEMPAEDGYLRVRKTSSSTGFVSHHGVAMADGDGGQMLFGVTANGVMAYRGAGQWATALDQWDRVIEGGVNQLALHRSVAAVWQAKRLFLAAVPSAGSQVNDRLYLFDWTRRRHWLWKLPWGVSSILSDRDSRGRERILFGTDDGFIQTLVDAPTDDGVNVEGVARSIPLRFGDQQTAFVRALLEVQDPGAKTLRFQSYLDGRESHGGRTTPASATPYLQKKSISLTSGQAVWDSGVFDTSRWGDGRFIETEVPLKQETRGTRFQYELYGTCRWKLKEAHVQVRPLGHKRGKLRG